MANAGAQTLPPVTIVIPTLNEERHIDACLTALAAQTYQGSIEILVLDGGSTDTTLDLVARHENVRVHENPNRIQAAASNLAMHLAHGELLAYVSAHMVVAPDYIERAVEALQQTGAVMVGGRVTPKGSTSTQKGIAAALRSRFGAGPGTYRRGGVAGWADSVPQPIYRREDAIAVGGYDEARAVNEDAEFAIRMATRGGVWYEPRVTSDYYGRDSLVALARQFYAYGLGRAATVVDHPGSLRPRQLAAPLLVVGLLTPYRRWVAGAYAVLVVSSAAEETRSELSEFPIAAASIPVLHLSWGIGFWIGLVRAVLRRRA